MRRLLALLALVVTTWSNVGMMRCASTTAAPGPESVGGPHAHGEHVPQATGDDANRHVTGPTDAALRSMEDGPSSRPIAQECGVAMACGTALGGNGALPTNGPSKPLDGALPSSSEAPAAITLSLDPPPPRRLA